MFIYAEEGVLWIENQIYKSLETNAGESFQRKRKAQLQNNLVSPWKKRVEISECRRNDYQILHYRKEKVIQTA